MKLPEIGDYVHTTNGHSGSVTKIYKVTGAGISVHIRESDGRIYYCPINMLKEADHA